MKMMSLYEEDGEDEREEDEEKLKKVLDIVASL